MKGRLWLCCIPLFLRVFAASAWGIDLVPARIDGLTNTGNVMAYVLPAAALSLTAFNKDGEGFWQLGESVMITMTVTVGLKYAVDARRPDGDPHSFPSGHAAITFSSAEFVRKRYGWKYGGPAYLFASFVGYSRVRSHQHYFRDVAAGAGIGIATSYIISTPYHGWHIQPELGSGYHGVRISRGF